MDLESSSKEGWNRAFQSTNPDRSAFLHSKDHFELDILPVMLLHNFFGLFVEESFQGRPLVVDSSLLFVGKRVEIFYKNFYIYNSIEIASFKGISLSHEKQCLNSSAQSVFL
jgi:hypothetical protein